MYFYNDKIVFERNIFLDILRMEKIMNNQELAYKLKYILHELGLNKTEFLNACRIFSPSISKPTILNAINGKNTIAPTVETLSIIIKVCQTSSNEKLKYISYDFLLNDTIQEIQANNAQVYQEIGLSDEVINRLKQYNHPLYYDYGNIINFYLYHIPNHYWKYLEFFKITCAIKNSLIKEDMKTLWQRIDNDAYLAYLEYNFKNVYQLLNNIRKNKQIENKETLLRFLEIVKQHFKYLLNELGSDFYQLIEEEK